MRAGDICRDAVVTGGVGGMLSKKAQALGRGPSVDNVRAGRRLVEEARWRIGGGGERVAIKEEREQVGREARVPASDSGFVPTENEYGSGGDHLVTRIMS